jgi:hypothetical protein
MNKTERRQEVVRVAREVAHLSNWSLQEDFDVFAKALMSEHRTIQQSVFRLMARCVQEWATMHDDGMYDARNEATVTISKELWDRFLKDNGVPYI